MLIVTMISGHIQYLRHTVSIGNRFPWHYIVFSLRDSSVSSYNLVFSCDGCQEGGRGCMFLKKGGRGVKKEMEADIFPHNAPLECSQDHMSFMNQDLLQPF